ncbi:MAG: hypothetical protein HY331_17890 [Chloroflexi bacterium]|nr:hypothetical protein [Chloroflexota bacterium]
MAEKNKNQTAAERAAANDRLSGKSCTKCGKDVKIKDLLHVRQVSLATRQKQVLAYHRACYTH